MQIWDNVVLRDLAFGLGVLGFGATILAGCSSSTSTEVKQAVSEPIASERYQDILLTQLIDAKPGDIITIPEGRYAFDRGLSLTVDGVTLRGAGMDKTVLDFKGQVAGAEGLLVTASNFTIEDLAVEDSKGDAIKVNEGDNIVFRRVRTEWTNGPDTKNGAYGFYPVQTTNVLIEDCVAIAAADAGIYVGQSKNVVVRNNRAEYNVAGIEIENTQGADVYGNVALNNTGGILVFNMPNLTQAGGDVRVFKNKVYENNTRNFGHKGTPVAGIPAGSGIVINSHDHIEVFDNDVRDNKTANLIISSIFTANNGIEGMEENFDPYPENIHVYSNRFSGGGQSPDGLDLKALKTMMFGLTGRFPDILWDGYVNPALKTPNICVQNDGAEILNADIPNKTKDPRLVLEAFNCSLPPLTPIRLAIAE